MTPHCERDDSEIEITPEMIEAGLAEFFAYDSRFQSEEEAVKRIYGAMEKAREGSAVAMGDSRS